MTDGATITYTGRAFYPLRDDPGEIVIEDIAHHLSMTARYGGALKRFYSVAEHSYLLSCAVPEPMALEALLHDAAETYLGDIRKPLKTQPFMTPYIAAENRLQDRIYDTFSVRRTLASAEMITEYDARIVIDEVLTLHMKPQRLLDRWEYEPLNVRVLGCKPEHAEMLFLLRFEELTA